MFSGGYVGVDVFFVISGYLITSLIAAELEANRFSIVQFYERRARRILPALFLVVAASVPFAWLWLLPSELAEFSQSVAAVAVFGSNILFWRQSGYFDPPAELKPLLHTWSLGVEEQFYVLFPLFFLLTWRLGKKWMLALLTCLALVSLTLAHWGAYQKPAAAFFLLPTRAWELALGSFLAFYLAQTHLHTLPLAARESGAFIGLILLVASLFAFDSATPFPSLYTLLPTVGTALLILFAWPDTLVGRILGTKPLVGIGLISYSAYLWHQPLFAFARARSLLNPSPSVFGLLAVAALILAYFSWRYVEQPFREKNRIPRRQVFALSAVGSVIMLAFGIGAAVAPTLILGSETWAYRETLEQRIKANYGLDRACDSAIPLTSEECRTSDRPDLLLWGDSYAMHLAQGFLVSNPRIKMMQSTMTACGPILGIAPLNVTRGHGVDFGRVCINNNDEILNFLRKTPTIKHVVLASLFHQYALPDWRLLLRDGNVIDTDPATVDRALRNTLDQLKQVGVEVVIISPTPQDGRDVGRCAIKAMMNDRSADVCNIALDDVERAQKNRFDLLRGIEKEVRIIWLADGMCEGGICKAMMDGKIIYRDDGHLSIEGSAYLGRKMDFWHLATGK